LTLQLAEITLRVPLQPKDRPRASTRDGVLRSHRAPKYVAWMREARALLQKHWAGPPLTHNNLINVRMLFSGPGRSDLDNLVGAVLDAGTGIIWVDDKVTVIRYIEASWKQKPIKDQSIYLGIIYDG